MNGLRACVACLLAVLGIFPLLAAGQEVSLTILHTNDTHDRLFPFSYPARAPAGSDLAGLTSRKDIGGIARRAALVKRLRQSLRGRSGAVWLVDSGDFSEGTIFGREYHGLAAAEAMNSAGYMFGTLGNHEFNLPLAQLHRLVAAFRYPVLCANAVETATGKSLASESAITAVGPLKVGVFGLVTREASYARAAREGVRIDEELATAQQMVQSLRTRAGLIVMLSHAGEDVDERIAASVPGIDVIVGGHTHTRLTGGFFVWQSDELKARDVNGTVIVQAHQWGGELGRLDLLIGKERGKWHIVRYRARLIPVDSTLPDDPETAAVVERYWRPVAARYGEVIGKAVGDFSWRGDDLAPYNLVSDLLRETFTTDIAFVSIGNITGPLVQGDITRGDLATICPYDDFVATFRISGRRIRELLQTQQPGVSGIRYRIQGGRLAEATVDGKALDDAREYTACANGYIVTQGSLRDLQYADTGRRELDVIVDGIRNKGTIHPVHDGRRAIVEE